MKKYKRTNNDLQKTYA